MLELDREAPQQAETVPSHYNKVASCMPGSILPPNARTVDCKGGALGDSQLGNQSASAPDTSQRKGALRKMSQDGANTCWEMKNPIVSSKGKRKSRGERQTWRQVAARAVFLAH